MLENCENIDESITSITKDRLNTLNDLLEEKLKVVKKYDEEILQLCEIKEIENEIEVAEELNSRVLYVKKLISNFFANKEISDTKKLLIQDISIPDKDTPQVGTSQVSAISSVFNPSDANQNEQISVNAIQDPTSVLTPNGSNRSTINPNLCNPSTSQSGIYETYVAKSKLPKLTLPRFKGIKYYRVSTILGQF